MDRLKEIAKAFINLIEKNLIKPSARACIKGQLTLNVYKNGELIETSIDNNLIVNQGQAWVLDLLSNNTTLFVEKIRIGSSDAAAAVTDTAVTPFSPDYTKAVTPLVTGNICSYDFTIGTGDANGNLIKEWGLLLDDGTLIARIIKTPIPKDNTISIQGNWKWNVYFNNEFTV